MNTNSNRFLVIAALFITCIITANIIIVKQINFIGFTLPAAIIIFPLSYILGDVLTKVYGYRHARRVIWLGFFCNLLAVIFFWLSSILPSASTFTAQQAFETILGSTPRFLIASFVAYIAGEFVNSYILAKMKLLTKGKWLWARTIGSTLAGQGLDTVIVLSIGFWGVLPAPVVSGMILAHWSFKCIYEIIFTPVTYAVVNYLKKAEGIDYYDANTNFNPLHAD